MDDFDNYWVVVDTEYNEISRRSRDSVHLCNAFAELESKGSEGQNSKTFFVCQNVVSANGDTATLEIRSIFHNGVKYTEAKA